MRASIPRCAAPPGTCITTIWVPLATLKAVRLGPARYEHCPVGHHWASVTRLEDDPATTEEELKEAALVHDVRIP